MLKRTTHPRKAAHPRKSAALHPARSAAPSATSRQAWPWSALGGGVLVVAATLGLLFVAPAADAGSCDRRGRSGVSFSIGIGHHDHGSRGHVGVTYRRGHDRGHYRGHDRHRTYDRGHRRAHDRGYRYDRHYDRPRKSYDRHDRRYHRGYDRHVRRGHGYGHGRDYRHHGRHGYWKRVWCPPVYRTHYLPCGTPKRVCVRAGYYRNVYVRVGVGYH